MSAPHSDREPLELLAEEFADRFRRGERPSLTEYVRRHPDLAEEIRELFPALVLMEKFGSVAEPPTASEHASPADSEPRPQQLGEYRILREVGHGGMGVVYEAVQESLGRHVALKVLPFNALLNPTQLERFRRESRAAARLHHTNIVPVFAVGDQDGVHYYVMQYIQGQGLDVVLRDLKQMRATSAAPSEGRRPAAGNHPGAGIAEGLVSGCFPCGEPADGSGPVRDSAAAVARATETSGETPPDSLSSLASHSETRFFRSVAQVGVQVAEALAYAHRQGVLHRDIKPSNLLLDTRGTVWVTDFGLAKAEGTDELTSPGDIVGTIRYMAPERFQGHADPRSDVYGLGATLYELLTLRPAFDDGNRIRLIERVTRQEPPRPRKLDSRIPLDLENIVLKAIAKEPAERYADAQALADDLRSFLADRPIRARRNSAAERAWRWCRRNQVVAGLGAAAAISLLLGTAASTLFALAARREAKDAERHRREATASLYHALVGEARALRLARESGYRPKVWERLTRARWLDTPERDLDELRREAVACMGDFVGLEPRVWEVAGIGRLRGQRLAPHPDGSQVALGLGDGTVLVRNWATGDVTALREHGAEVTAAAFTPDGSKLVTGDVRGVVHVWEPDAAGRWTWARGLQLAAPSQPLFLGIEMAIAVSPDGRHVAACPALSTTLLVWDLSDGALVQKLNSPEGELLHGLAWSPDGRLLAAGYRIDRKDEHGVIFWDVAGRRWLPRQPSDVGYVFALAFSPDGSMLAAGCNDAVAVLDMSPRRTSLTKRFEMRGSDVHSVAFSRDNRKLFIATGNHGAVWLWDLTANRELAALQQPGGPFAVALGKDGNTLFAVSHRSVYAWGLRPPAEKVAPAGHFKVVTGLTYSPDGKLLASSGKDRFVRVWDPQTGRLVWEFTGFQGVPRTVAFSQDSRLLATSSRSGDRRLYDLRTGEYQRLPECRPGEILGLVAFSPDGNLFAAGGMDGLRVWRVRRRGAALTADYLVPESLRDEAASAGTGGITAVCFSPDSKRMAWVKRGSAETGCIICYCDLPDGPTRTLAARPRHFLKPLAFTPDGRHLTFVSDREKIEVWDVENGQQVDAYGNEELLSGDGIIALSDDGSWLASSGNRCITIWDTASHKLLLTLPEQQSTVWGLAWSPDREQLAVCFSDGGPVIWNIGAIQEQLRSLDLDW